MKKANYKPVYWLILLCLVITAVWVQFLPDTVPVHFGPTGEADRYGSRYELFIPPLIFTVFGLLFPVISRFTAKEQPGNERTMVRIFTGTLVFFNVLQVYLLYTASNYVPDAANNADTLKLVCIAMGVLLIFISNLMPKAEMNSAFGLRTPWSSKSPEVWQKSQRFGAYSGIGCGLLLILCGVFFTGITATVMLLVVILVWGVIATVGSYLISKRAES